MKELLNAAVSAPSAGNQQPWQFIVIDDKQLMTRITDYLPNGKLLKNADKAIVICGDTIVEKYKGYWMLDCSAATQNILLAAHAHGLGSCWLGVYPRKERVENLQRLLKTPAGIIPFAVVALGYSEESGSSVDRLDSNTIHQNHW